MRRSTFIPLAIFIMVALLTSCNHRESTIYIITTNVVGMNENQIRKNTMTTVESEYFEVKLSSVNSGELYIAGKQILKPQIGKEYKTEFFKVVDEKGKELEFKTPADFLNFMDKAGYEMKQQDKEQYGIDYTFKKNP